MRAGAFPRGISSGSGRARAEAEIDASLDWNRRTPAPDFPSRDFERKRPREDGSGDRRELGLEQTHAAPDFPSRKIRGLAPRKARGARQRRTARSAQLSPDWTQRRSRCARLHTQCAPVCGARPLLARILGIGPGGRIFGWRGMRSRDRPALRRATLSKSGRKTCAAREDGPLTCAGMGIVWRGALWEGFRARRFAAYFGRDGLLARAGGADAALTARRLAGSEGRIARRSYKRLGRFCGILSSCGISS